MAIDIETEVEATTCSWGTKEELLLVCAVQKHGCMNWDSVVMELHNRTSHPVTPNNCKHKYYQLYRRFFSKPNEEFGETQIIKDDKKNLSRLCQELRKRRVQQLKLGLQRNDASIMSLQLKVKRLTEERERSFRDNGIGEANLDPIDAGYKSSPENVADVHENRSFKESNWMDLEEKKKKNADDDEQKRDDSGRPDPIREYVPVRCRGDGDSDGLYGSGPESKEERIKENSDVLSSASLSRKSCREKVFSETSTTSGADEPGTTEEESPAKNRSTMKSEPLNHYLEIIQSDRYGSVFEHRLKSQKTAKYNSLIRKHVDFEIIMTRIDEGCYTGCELRFLRDVYLLFNNALVFFPRNSDEYYAALQLRKLVSNRISTQIRQSNPPCPIPKADPEPLNFFKPEPSSSVVPSRKRSVIKRKQTVAVDGDKDENEGKKTTKETKSASGVRSLRTGVSMRKENYTRSSNRNLCPEAKPTSETKDESTEEKRNKEGSASEAKKRGAADFLDRIKRNSSSLEKKGKGGGSGRGAAVGRTRKTGEEGKREQDTARAERRVQEDKARDRDSTRGGRRVQEDKTPAKRNVGRPPKRSAAPLPPASPSPPPPPSKRKTRATDSDKVGGRERQQRKRTRK